MFPHLFPYGRGHRGERRQIKVSQNECISHYRFVSPRRFGEGPTFFLVAFDLVINFDVYHTISFHQLGSAFCQNEMRQQERISPRIQYIEAVIEDVLALHRNNFGLVTGSYEVTETQGGRTLHAHFNYDRLQAITIPLTAFSAPFNTALPPEFPVCDRCGSATNSLFVLR
ncbi:hypothetical protein PHMEG_00010047 [Phytophthora megakarya]|uniref:Uncharacterized protein n=1 Tax=Phytophthora megakarya TaxID=4795 RepID=A0A225WEN1_9STRA|nr:hypothetical protein PHMEG_00010047 [Phytophthora megakarya]